MNVAASAVGAGATPSRRRKVLLAEDVDSNAWWEQDALEYLGCEVLRVCNGAMAVALATTRRFDIILMDCRMPVMDGLHATQAIRHFEGTVHRAPTPIIAVTASVMPFERQRCIDAGMDAVLAKPFMLDELERVLVRWVAHRKSRYENRKITCLRQALTSPRMAS